MWAKNISLDNLQENYRFQAGETVIDGFISKQGVANFLGIPFARVPQRFRAAQQTNLQPGTIDASQYGPRCPQGDDPLHSIMSNVFEKLSATQRQDEETCLHVNIYVPGAIVEAAGDHSLPVFAWIHGGGFNNGDNTTEFGPCPS